MLPGFRILVATIVLSASVLVFGLGAAALLRAAHEEFASLPSWRLAQPPLLSPKIEPAAPATLALLRLETPQARFEPLRIEPLRIEPEPYRIENRAPDIRAPETAAPAMSAPEVQAETLVEVQTVTANTPHETGGVADEKSDAVLIVAVATARPDAEPASAVSAPPRVASVNAKSDGKADNKTNTRASTKTNSGTNSSPSAPDARSTPEVTNTEATSSESGKTEITSSEMAALVAKASEATAAAEQQADPVVTKTNRSSARAAARRRAAAVARARAAARARAVQQQPQQNPFPLFGG